jgi:transposase-like protein
MTGMAHTKLTPERQSRIVEALAQGNYIETAARYSGISSQGFYKWMSRGNEERQRVQDGEKPKESETMYVEFVEAVEKARSQAEMRNVGLIQKAAVDGTWQAAAWFLERSYPRRWSRSERIEHTGADGGSLDIQVSMDDLEEKVKQLLARRSPSKDS